MFNFLLEAKEGKKDPTKLGTGEKVVGGLGIAGGLGLGAIGKVGASESNRIAREHERIVQDALGDRGTLVGKLKREAYETSPVKVDFDAAQRHLHQQSEEGNFFGNAGLATAGTIAAGLAAHKLYKTYKNKKK